jgi:lauroyl/myristoyl acyltransferase
MMMESGPPADAGTPTRLIDARDVFNAAVFLGLAPAAWLLPETAWGRLARLCATAHLALRRSAAADLSGHAALAATNHSPVELERTVLAGKYEEMLQTLREHRPGGWIGRIRLVGGENLDAALATGRGAVLWVAPCNFAELNVKKALHAAGHPITNLRSYVHPYSGTRFGRAWLNRIRTSVEDRYLAGTATLYPTGGPAALRELQSRLRENGVVSITANSGGDQPCRLPCLGGTLNLALGGAALARIAKAPLLPVFAAPAQAGTYVVEVHPALHTEHEVRGRRQDELLAAAFVTRLEAFVKRHPTVWRGWEPRPVVDPAAMS